LSLVKYQALDAACSGSGLIFTTTPITTGAVPGACIRYRIVARNNGLTAINNVHIYDSTPPYTTRNDGGGAPTLNGSPVTPVSAPTNGNASPPGFDFNIGTLAAGAQAVIEFSVKITQ